MDDAVQQYIDAIQPEHRPLFDRVHGLILEVAPQAEVAISYEIPTYKVDRARLYVGAWKHGISLYGWGQGRDGGFTDRHPDLRTGKGTIRLRPEDAADISDDELRRLISAALAVDAPIESEEHRKRVDDAAQKVMDAQTDAIKRLGE